MLADSGVPIVQDDVDERLHGALVPQLPQRRGRVLTNAGCSIVQNDVDERHDCRHIAQLSQRRCRVLTHGGVFHPEHA